MENKKNWYLYCLSLYDDNQKNIPRYYVGISTDPERRIKDHKNKNNKASQYTKAYIVKQTKLKVDLGSADHSLCAKIESQFTLDLMKQVGCLPVRGGAFTTLADLEFKQLYNSIFKNNQAKKNQVSYDFPVEWNDYITYNDAQIDGFFDKYSSQKQLQTIFDRETKDSSDTKL